MNPRNRIFYTLLSSILCANVCAQNFDANTLEALARQYVHTTAGLKVNDSIPFVQGVMVTCPTDRSGFILTSKDRRLPMVLAYSDNEYFSVDQMPPQIRNWLDGYQEMCSVAEYAPDVLDAWLSACSLPIDDVEPILGKTIWGQDNPYNNFCPMVNGNRCPTGCVATALAQVMRYHQWPIEGTGCIDYVTSSAQIPISYDFSSVTFNWQAMRDTYQESVPTTPEEVSLVDDHRFLARSISIVDTVTSGGKCCVEISKISIMGASGFSGETAMVLSDANGGIVRQVSSNRVINSPNSGLLLNSARFNISVPEDLPDGRYFLYNVVHEADSTVWSVTVIQNSQNSRPLMIRKSGNLFTIGRMKFSCSEPDTVWHPVATLMQAVGASVKMNYASNASGATDRDALNGLKTYLGYDADMFFASPEEFTDKQWHEMLQSELSQGRPVYYTGQGIGSGHAFVIDGMRKDRETRLVYYHVNWGWDGLCNGYYLLNMLRPTDTGTGGSSGSNYSNNPSMLVGMKPEDGVKSLKMTCKGLHISRMELFAGQLVTVKIDNLKLRGDGNHSGDLKLELYPMSETGYEPIVIYCEPNRHINSSGGLNNYLVPCRLPMHIEEGEYEVRLSWNGADGEVMEISIDSWPQITVKSKEEWPGGDDTQPLQLLTTGKMWRAITYDTDGELTIDIDSVVNPLLEDVEGYIALLLCDRNGALIKPLDDRKFMSVNGYSVVNSVKLDGTLSRHIPDGNYTLRPGFLHRNDTVWTFCDRMIGDDIYWTDYEMFAIDISVTDGVIVIDGVAILEGADIPWTDGIPSIVSDLLFPECIYDMSGRKSEANQPGIYIIRQNNTVKKVKK